MLVAPGAQHFDERRALALPPYEALLERFAASFRFGLDVEDRGVPLDAAARPLVAAAQCLDQLATRVRVAAAARAARALDAMVDGRSVAHHARETAAREARGEVVAVARRCVEEVRVDVSSFAAGASANGSSICKRRIVSLGGRLRDFAALSFVPAANLLKALPRFVAHLECTNERARPKQIGQFHAELMPKNG